MRTLRLRTTAALVALLLPAVAAAQTIDTRNADPLTTIASRPFGQTFTAPGDLLLQRFAFFVTLGADAESRYRGVIVRWDGTAPVGPALYESEERVVGCCAILETSFLTGGIAVTAGDVYAALIVPTAGAIAHALPGDGLGDYADTYAGGGAVSAACPTDLASCTFGVDAYDRAFVAQFSRATVVAPEPRAPLLLAAGALGVGIAARRRRR